MMAVSDADLTRPNHQALYTSISFSLPLLDDDETLASLSLPPRQCPQTKGGRKKRRDMGRTAPPEKLSFFLVRN